MFQTKTEQHINFVHISILTNKKTHHQQQQTHSDTDTLPESECVCVFDILFSL